MAINKVGSKGIIDGAIAAIDFADETVSSDKFANTTIENAKLTNTSITAAGTSITLGGSATFNNQFVDWQSKVTSDGSTVTTMVSGQGYFVDNSSAAGIVKLSIIFISLSFNISLIETALILLIFAHFIAAL